MLVVLEGIDSGGIVVGGIGLEGIVLVGRGPGVAVPARMGPVGQDLEAIDLAEVGSVGSPDCQVIGLVGLKLELAVRVLDCRKDSGFGESTALGEIRSDRSDIVLWTRNESVRESEGTNSG